MEVFLLISFLVISILLVIYGLKDKNIVGFFLGACFTISIIWIVEITDRILYKDERKLTPIEVYRGNTTLEITYCDSIPVDSVVVWKNKNEEVMFRTTQAAKSNINQE